ncbi:MAG TPA: glycosyltransferase, partial [Roseivirga sp.]
KWGRIPFVINGEHGAFFMKPRQRIIQKIIYRLCDANLSVSEDLRQRVTQRLGIPPEKITTIANGVDCDKFTGKHDIKAIQEELALSPSSARLIIGNIGSLKPQKNQSLLISAVAQLKSSHPSLDIIVLLIGTGPDQQRLEKQARELGVSNIILFLGLREDIPQLLSIIDLLVSTSKSEGMSNVTLESFASEVPIVTTRSAGMGEIVQEGKTGFILNEGKVDELYQLLLAICSKPRHQLKSMGKTARAFVLEHHSINKMVENYEEFYLDLLESKSDPDL